VVERDRADRLHPINAEALLEDADEPVDRVARAQDVGSGQTRRGIDRGIDVLPVVARRRAVSGSDR
jgi:hypothetical protein